MGRTTGLGRRGWTACSWLHSCLPRKVVSQSPCLARRVPTMVPASPPHGTLHFVGSFLCLQPWRKILNLPTGQMRRLRPRERRTPRRAVVAERSLRIRHLDPSSLSPTWAGCTPKSLTGKTRSGLARQLLRDAPTPKCLGPWCGDFRDPMGLPSLKFPSSEIGDISKEVG